MGYLPPLSSRSVIFPLCGNPGIGGLSAAAVLAKYGLSVTVVESHSIPGGAAHAFVHRDKNGGEWHFETGPSLYSGMATRGKEANPLGSVLQVIGEELDLLKYDTWNVVVPEGKFLTRVGASQVRTGGVCLATTQRGRAAFCLPETMST